MTRRRRWVYLATGDVLMLLAGMSLGFLLLAPNWAALLGFICGLVTGLYLGTKANQRE